MAEMAAELRRSVKTFRQEVVTLGIPYTVKGKRGKLFVASEVRAHLRRIETEQATKKVVAFKPRKKGKIVSERFAAA